MSETAEATKTDVKTDTKPEVEQTLKDETSAPPAGVNEIVAALTRLTEVFGKFIERQTIQQSSVPIKAAVYRVAQTRFRLDFAGWLAEQKVLEIINVTQSESDGNVTITIFYR